MNIARNCIAFIVVAVLASVSAAPRAVAAPGDLDPAFGGFGAGGRITNAPLSIRALALQADGKIVVAGQRDHTFALARYTAGGALDASFGSGGLVVTIIFASQSDATANAVAVQGDDKIVAAGSATIAGKRDFALARYNPDGKLDSNFSGDGTLFSDFDDSNDIANAITIQGDGKIVVAGTAAIGHSFECALERFNANGVLDPGFNGNGKAAVSFGPIATTTCSAMALQADGKIVVACRQSSLNSPANFALARLTTAGALDPAFGAGGRVTTALGGDATPWALALQPDGKIVVAGDRDNNSFALARYDPNGVLDTHFGGFGKLITPLDAPAGARAAIVQPDGKIVAAGGADGHFALARYTPIGALDPSFDGDGKLIGDIPDPVAALAQALARQPDGRLIAGGGGDLARYFPDGALDSGGRITTDIAGLDNRVYAATALLDGAIVAGGVTARGGVDYRTTLTRFNADGALDPTFGGDGIVISDFGGGVNDLAVQPDRKIVAAILSGDGFALAPGNTLVAAGSAFNGSNDDFALARYLMDDQGSKTVYLPLVRR